ncbi:MAG: hypothetical protein HZB44_06650 [Actinobacteria bacterium]|nr:hypothetical protein [Actinomycetota bacterium]
MDESDAISKCWEMKPNCMMKHVDREKASCPAYRENLGCWEVDWEAVVTVLPGSQREYWLSFLASCEKCIAYQAHPEEMQGRIDAVRSLIQAD